MSQSFTTDDLKFLRACGASAEMTPAEYLDANLHRDLADCRWCGVRTFQQHASDCRHGAASDVCWLADDWMTYERRETVFTSEDLKFLALIGAAEPTIKIAHPDGTVKILERLGIPVTRGDYLMLAFAGHPPEEPLDGEIEAELPEGIRTAEDLDYDDDACTASLTPQEESDEEED